MRFAFLRAVNVGGKNKVPMKELVVAVRGAGLGDADYLLQSGNLALSATDLSDQDLREGLERLLATRFDVQTRVVLRTPAALAQALSLNPFADHELVHVALWDEEPDADGLKALTEETFADAQLQLAPGTAYISYTGGSHNSKLTGALIERRLKVAATARNLRTLERMLKRWPG